MKPTSPYERYNRQILLKEFGESAQLKLLQAKVLVVGAGGLGCPALQYLVAAGIGTIGIVDDDKVALSNLHRQPIYTMNDIGLPKAEVAAQRLKQLNPDIQIQVYNERLTNSNAIEIINLFDIVVDGTDNFATRYLVNDACVLLKKALVYGSVSRFEGQIAVFNVQETGKHPSANYRDIFPEPPRENEVLNCAEAGVLGVLPGIIGSMQASETIKLITGIGKPLTNSLLIYNALNNQTYEIAIESKPATSSLIPSSVEEFQQFNYDWLCAALPSDFEIEINEFDRLLENEDAVFIDVRELHETPVVTEFIHQRIPLSLIREEAFTDNPGIIVLFCQSGKRSLEAAKYLSSIPGISKNIFSLKGGISHWITRRQNPSIV